MSRPDDRLARRAYRVLLRAYPAEQRQRYGADMEDAFLRLLDRDVARSGSLGALRCWTGAVVDGAVGGLAARVARIAQGPRGGGEVMGTLLSDLRFALRSLARRPVFTSTAVLTIAVAIGANASVFTIVNGFLFRPLPYEDPDELVAIWSDNQTLGWFGTDVDPRDAWDWRERARTLEDLTLFDDASFNWTGGERPEIVPALSATPNFLSVLGIEPVLGRDFEPTEVGEGRNRVALLADGFWERRFARDPGVVGETLQLDGEPVVVVGILPPGFVFHDERFDLLRPWDFDPASSPPTGHFGTVVARLADGVGIGAAREELADISRALQGERSENEGWTVSVVPLHDDVVGDVASRASVVLMGAVGFILLMACVNVANLLLARGNARTRELAVRVALGAGRGRVVRHLLTESLLLATAGGAIGLVSATWGARTIAAALPSTLPPVFEFGIDANVLVFTASITIGAALLFGIVPALRVSGASMEALRDGGRTGRSRGASRFGAALVVLQTAMAIVLLVGGGLLMKSLTGMRSQDFGFDPTNVLTARVALPAAQYETREESEAFWRDVVERLRGLNGVVGVGTTQSHPLMGSNWGLSLQIAGRALAEDESRSVRLTYASPGLFEALGFTMVRGRVFAEADPPEAEPVAIVNETFVSRYLGSGADALGTSLRSGEDWSATVVGVVHDVVERGVESPPEPALYLPIAHNDIRVRSLVLRTIGDPTEHVDAVEAAVWQVDPDLPLYEVETMETLVDRRIGGFAVIGYLMGAFALLSLLLGAVGIYGVTAYAAGQRTNEIGVRLAMGAERNDVVRMVVRDGVRRTVIGVLIGLGLALLLGGAMSGILIGVSPRDPVIFTSVVATLVAVSLLGLWLPARRASRVDPVRALTAE